MSVDMHRPVRGALLLAVCAAGAFYGAWWIGGESLGGSIAANGAVTFKPWDLARQQVLALVSSKQHKSLWPLERRDAIGFVLASLALILAASGGIGGGGLLVPLYLVVFRFAASSAVALSNATILGGTLVNFAFNIRRRHPDRDAPLINWDLILVMEPSTIVGAIFGGYINHLLPDWLTTVALAALLAFITHRLVVRVMLLRRMERLCDSKAQHSLRRGSTANISASSLSGAQRSPVSVILEEDDTHAPAASSSAAATPLEEPLLEPVSSTREEAYALPPSPALNGSGSGWRPPRRAEVPFWKLSILLALVAGVVASNVAKRSLPCPSLPYWLAATAIVPAIVLLLFFVRRHLLRQAAAQCAAAATPFSPPQDDVAWTPKTTVLYPALCTFAGVCAGMFGVGGGIVKGPLMLEMGVPPKVAAATSATMILFTSASASVVFLSFGALPLDYGAALFGVGAASTAVGHLLTSWAARRLHSKTLIVELMAAFMALSTVVLAAQGGVVTRGALRDGELWRWGSICGGAQVERRWTP